MRLLDLDCQGTLASLVAAGAPVLGENAGRNGKVDPLPIVTVIALANLEGTDLDFLDRKLIKGKTELFLAGDFCGVVAREEGVVNQQCVLLICRLSNFLSY